MQRRFASILLLLTFALLGTGALRFAHDLGHLREDAAAAAQHRNEPSAPPVHTEWNCDLHALLGGPLLAAAAVPLLILLGLFVAFLTQLTPAPVSVRPSVRLHSRGPPAC